MRSPPLISWLPALLLAACAGGPPVPDWQANAHAALAAHTRAYLSGDDRVARQELAAARRETSRTGRAEPAARVELAACAAQLASLTTIAGCPAFAALAPDAPPELNSYADYLAGRWPGLNTAHLPAAQRAIPAATDDRALIDIADPLSRLVAAAGLLRAGRLSPAGIALAIDTAAAQGWRRPLLAWLAVDQQRLAQAGEGAAAAARERQRERILNSY